MGELSRSKCSFNVVLIKDRTKFCVLMFVQMLVLIFYCPLPVPGWSAPPGLRVHPESRPVSLCVPPGLVLMGRLAAVCPRGLLGALFLERTSWKARSASAAAWETGKASVPARACLEGPPWWPRWGSGQSPSLQLCPTSRGSCPRGSCEHWLPLQSELKGGAAQAWPQDNCSWGLVSVLRTLPPSCGQGLFLRASFRGGAHVQGKCHLAHPLGALGSRGSFSASRAWKALCLPTRSTALGAPPQPQCAALSSSAGRQPPVLLVLLCS